MENTEIINKTSSQNSLSDKKETNKMEKASNKIELVCKKSVMRQSVRDEKRDIGIE